VICAII